VALFEFMKKSFTDPETRVFHAAVEDLVILARTVCD